MSFCKWGGGTRGRAMHMGPTCHNTEEGDHLFPSYFGDVHDSGRLRKAAVLYSQEYAQAAQTQPSPSAIALHCQLPHLPGAVGHESTRVGSRAQCQVLRRRQAQFVFNVQLSSDVYSDRKY